MQNSHRAQGTSSMNYRKLAVMLAISFIIMYGVMFFNVDEANHIYLSATRTYMTLLMISPMAIVMLACMRKMYANRRLNTAILTCSILSFAMALFCLRRQVLIGDEQYMKGMIPHHSSAIMTSRHADIKDPELKKLSEEIIKSQEEEIARMKAILARMEKL